MGLWRKGQSQRRTPEGADGSGLSSISADIGVVIAEIDGAIRRVNKLRKGQRPPRRKRRD